MTDKILKRYSYDVIANDFMSAGKSSSAIKSNLKSLGIASDIIRKIAIISYEAELNLVIHSFGGKLHCDIFENKIVIISEDTGPGIADVDLAMKEGFSTAGDSVRELGFGARAIKLKIDKEKTVRPYISTYCPAAVRLIKYRYPSLMDNLILIREPMEIAGILARERVRKNFGLKDEDIKVFYISPCPAKLLAVTNPIGDYKPSVDWVIPLNKIYGDLYRDVIREDNNTCSYPSLLGVKWAVAGGQSEHAELKNYLAVHGMENIIEIMEEIENGKLSNIDFVEASACVNGCVGGTFNVVNPFIATSNINYILNSLDDECINPDIDRFDEMYKTGFFNYKLKEEERPDQLNLKEAVERQEKIKEICDMLPGLDCGSCGAPTCLAHAEDVYNKESEFYDCVVLRAKK
jgi:hypothetical protein